MHECARVEGFDRQESRRPKRTPKDITVELRRFGVREQNSAALRLAILEKRSYFGHVLCSRRSESSSHHVTVFHALV